MAAALLQGPSALLSCCCDVITEKVYYFQCDMKGVGYDQSYLTTFCDEHGIEGW